MYRLPAAMFFALASCLLSVNELTAIPLTSVTCNLQLRISAPPPPSENDLILILELESDGAGKFSIQPSAPATLTQHLQSLRESAIDAFFKQLHKA